jgi:tol-pal system protein YbgF
MKRLTDTVSPSLKRRCRIAFLAAVLLSMGTAQAALFGDDDARKAILELRLKLDELQQKGSEDLRKVNEENAQVNAQLRRSILELASQIEMSRSELARMRGQDEQFARDLSTVQISQKDLMQVLEDRLKKFEPSKVLVDGLEFVAEPAEQRDFDAALANLRKGEFAKAQASFSDFNRRYPSSGYRPSALFWLGNALYAQRDYKEAIGNFRALMTAAPTHLRAPEALLSIANCQIELKETVGARATLSQLLSAYPQSEAATVGKARLAKLK